MRIVGHCNTFFNIVSDTCVRAHVHAHTNTTHIHTLRRAREARAQGFSLQHSTSVADGEGSWLVEIGQGHHHPHPVHGLRYLLPREGLGLHSVRPECVLAQQVADLLVCQLFHGPCIQLLQSYRQPILHTMSAKLVEGS